MMKDNDEALEKLKERRIKNHSDYTNWSYRTVDRGKDATIINSPELKPILELQKKLDTKIVVTDRPLPNRYSSVGVRTLKKKPKDSLS